MQRRGCEGGRSQKTREGARRVKAEIESIQKLLEVQEE